MKAHIVGSNVENKEYDELVDIKIDVFKQPYVVVKNEKLVLTSLISGNKFQVTSQYGYKMTYDGTVTEGLKLLTELLSKENK